MLRTRNALLLIIINFFSSIRRFIKPLLPYAYIKDNKHFIHDNFANRQIELSDCDYQLWLKANLLRSTGLLTRPLRVLVKIFFPQKQILLLKFIVNNIHSCL